MTLDDDVRHHIAWLPCKCTHRYSTTIVCAARGVMGVMISVILRTLGMAMFAWKAAKELNGG